MSSFLSTLSSLLPSVSARALLLLGLPVLLALQRNDGEYKQKLTVSLKPKSKEDEELDKIGLNDEYVPLLANFIKHTEKLQNYPPKLIPQEDLIADQIVDYLKPYSTESGGVLNVRKIAYVPGRSNVIVRVQGRTDKTVSIVGAHMDVVTANPTEWKRDPFTLTVEDDKLYGRGVTDCLGHVAMLVNLLKQIGEKKIQLNVNLIVVLIANEETSAILGVGVDALEAAGELAACKNGPLFWLDSANVGPTLGTGGSMTWSMEVSGKSMHSGTPNRGINALSLGAEAIKYIQRRFYAEFTHNEDAADYLYEIGSSLKPTQLFMPEGGLTNIPRSVTYKGDLRFTPFYTAAHIKQRVDQYVVDLNNLIRDGGLRAEGYESFVLPANSAFHGTSGSGAVQGLIEWKWGENMLKPIACDLTSTGYKALCDAIAEVIGTCRPFSLTGSLPIIADLKEKGFDVQVTGFGKLDAYHAANEYAHLSDLKQGARILMTLLQKLNRSL